VQLSPHFSLAEFTHSQLAGRLGIPNIPHWKHKQAMQFLCMEILEPLREELNAAIVISSGFRSAKLNAALGGAVNSQHTKGEAVDIIVPGIAPFAVAEAIISLKLPYDQLILEFKDWVHVSARAWKQPRREVLTACLVNKKLTYFQGLVRECAKR
jgi:hypothetical protein